MPRASLSSGIEIEYETFGEPGAPAMLLVAGFASQLLSWEVGFCQLLADGGLHVIRFDNRDAGLSTLLDPATARPQAVLNARLHGEPIPEVPYTLSDMAADGIGLLDELAIGAAHVMGMSMGGMIVQTMAIEHPDRVRSLTSVMSSTGSLQVGNPTKEALPILLRTPPTERDEFVAAARDTVIWASKRYGDADQIAERMGTAFDRSFTPSGNPRQLAAIHASGDRTEALAGVTVPTLVIHGLDDTLIGLDGGQATAEAIPHANLLVLADMGHDLPEPLWPLITSAVIGLTRTVAGAA